MRKDLGICLATANETGASLPVTALVDQFYKDVQKHGRRALGHLEPDQAAAQAGLAPRQGRPGALGGSLLALR